MEEVRSYWQVASITHFCTLFQKPFKLPQFEPEELEQAFIIDVPVTENQQFQDNIQIISNGKHNLENDTNDSSSDKDEDDNKSASESIDGSNHVKVNQIDTYSSSSGYLSSVDTNNRFQPHRNTSSYSSTLNYQNLENNFQTQAQTQQKAEEEQQDLHLLVELAVALLRPHFSTRINPNNWENYLKRLIDTNYIELDNQPSPFCVSFVSPEGIEQTKNLNFNDLALSDKVDIFCALCDYRFWCEDASDAIKDYPIEELRLESIGKDQQGYEYWYFSGTRLFRENRELSQDLVARKTRIKELEFELIGLQASRINREIEEKRKAEAEKARKLAQEAREARQAAKRQQEEEASASGDNVESSTKKRRRNNNLILPPRTGLRERRSSAASNNHDSIVQTPTRTTRGSLAKLTNVSGHAQNEQSQSQSSSQKATRSSTRGTKHSNQSEQTKVKKNLTPEPPKKDPEEACREELERSAITLEERKASWCIQCESLEDWESFVTRFEKTKSNNERYLYNYLNEDILPRVRAIYAKRAAEARRKEKEMLLSLATRRVSTRIISKKAQEEEEERQSQLREIEMQKKKAEAEIRLRAELEREMRARKNRFVINGGTSSACSEDGELENTSRYNLRQQHDLVEDPAHEFDGIIHPDRLSDFYEALELIIDTVRTSKFAWPFVDPVPETVPKYYDLIKEPMDLKKLRTKVEFRAYRSLIEVEKDFQLLINNCERFNGPKNVYTKMVYKLWKSFRKNVQLYLQRDLHMNEYETFIYPPQPPAPPPETSTTARPQQMTQPLQPSPNPVSQEPQRRNPNQSEISQPLDSQPEDSQPRSQESFNHVEESQQEQPKPLLGELELKSTTMQSSEPLSFNTSDPVQANTGSISSNQALESMIKSEVIQTQPAIMMQAGTIVEEIIYDTPEDNEIYVWQDTVVPEGQ